MVELPPSGTLWSYTVQRFRPKSPPYRGPEPFEPYALGYIHPTGGPSPLSPTRSATSSYPAH